MSTCCDTAASTKQSKKMLCPSCGVKQNFLPHQTLIHQLKNPKNIEVNPDIPYYFCRNSSCETVYFSPSQSSFSPDDLRWPVGQKSTEPDRQICYCFDVTYDQVVKELARDGVSKTKEFVMAQTKLKNCACEIRNPSGKCCLVDFPKG